MNSLKIEYVPITDIKPYAGNAKLHPDEQIEQIRKSIELMGFNDPIAIWKNGEIIEGHGRLLAAQQLGMETVPIIRLDDLTDEQRRAYALIHNKLTMNSGFDVETLEIELAEIHEFQMEDFSFSCEEIEFNTDDLDDDRTKSNVIVSINCGGVFNYEQVKERLQNITDEISGTMSVKMQ